MHAGIGSGEVKVLEDTAVLEGSGSDLEDEAEFMESEDGIGVSLGLTSRENSLETGVEVITIHVSEVVQVLELVISGLVGYTVASHHQVRVVLVRGQSLEGVIELSVGLSEENKGEGFSDVLAHLLVVLGIIVRD